MEIIVAATITAAGSILAAWISRKNQPKHNPRGGGGSPR